MSPRHTQTSSVPKLVPAKIHQSFPLPRSSTPVDPVQPYWMQHDVKLYCSERPQDMSRLVDHPKKDLYPRLDPASRTLSPGSGPSPQPLPTLTPEIELRKVRGSGWDTSLIEVW